MRMLTEKLFWETWPKVAAKFPSKKGNLRTAANQCPVIAVAHHLGLAKRAIP